MERLFISRGGKVCTAARLPEAVLGVRRVETPHLQQDAAARFGALAQLGERGLCKPEVRGSIPLCSTTNTDRRSKNRPAIFLSGDGRAGGATRRPHGGGLGCGRRNAAGAWRRVLADAPVPASPALENVSRETFRRIDVGSSLASSPRFPRPSDTGSTPARHWSHARPTIAPLGFHNTLHMLSTAPLPAAPLRPQSVSRETSVGLVRAIPAPSPRIFRGSHTCPTLVRHRSDIPPTRDSRPSDTRVKHFPQGYTHDFNRTFSQRRRTSSGMFHVKHSRGGSLRGSRECRSRVCGVGACGGSPRARDWRSARGGDPIARSWRAACGVRFGAVLGAQMFHVKQSVCELQLGRLRVGAGLAGSSFSTSFRGAVFHVKHVAGSAGLGGGCGAACGLRRRVRAAASCAAARPTQGRAAAWRLAAGRSPCRNRVGRVLDGRRLRVGFMEKRRGSPARPRTAAPCAPRRAVRAGLAW